jgi:phosphoesterase RecJ-like protein
LLSDTGGFRFPNTTVKCLDIAAELVAAGADPHFIAVQIYEQRTAGSLKLLSRALSKLEIFEGEQVAVVRLEQRDFEESQALSEEVEGIVDHLISLRGCLVGVLLRDGPDGSVKVNLRSRGAVRVNKIAEALGGGGHPNAAGYRTRGTLLQARDQALGEIKKWI